MGAGDRLLGVCVLVLGASPLLAQEHGIVDLPVPEDPAPVAATPEPEPLAALPPADANGPQRVRYTIDGRHTLPVFEVSHFGFSTQRGRFNEVRGNIEVDWAAHSGSVDITIETASIDMGVDGWDEEMRSERFFNTAAYPTMIYRADTLVFDGERPVAAHGNLALLGNVRPLTLTFTSFKCGVELATRRQKCGADVTTTFRRSEFGMGRYVPFIGDEVRLLIPVEAYRAP